MKNTKLSLLKKLNSVIDGELIKDTDVLDDELIYEAVDGILRTKKEPDYQITDEKRILNIRRIIDSAVKRRPGSRAAKVILVAAIVSVMLISAAFAYSVIESKITDHGTFSSIGIELFGRKKISPIEVGYVPEGFTLTFSEDKKSISVKEYQNSNGTGFSVVKTSKTENTTINTEFEKNYSVTVNGIEYIIYGEAEHGAGVFFIKDDCAYSVASTIPDEELLKIAMSLN